MTRSSYQRICALLAAAEVRHSDIVEFSRTLLQRGPDGVYEDVLRIRAQFYLAPDERGERAASGAPLNDELAEKVQRLLIDEAHLTKTQALDLLSLAVRRRYPAVEVAPDPKKGFAAWIRRLRTVVPESDLLHLATTIRNSLVHERPHDWRLK